MHLPALDALRSLDEPANPSGRDAEFGPLATALARRALLDSRPRS
jgi:hypothetical protein